MSEIRDEMEAAYDAASGDSSPSTADTSADSTPSATPPDSSPDPVSEPEAPQASDTAAAAPETPAPGPIPFARHQEVLENTRKQYAWLQEHGDPQTVQQKLAILRRAEQDPSGFLRDFAHAAGLNPQQLFAPPAPPTPPPAPPQPDVLLENGQMVYSDARMRELLEYERGQVLQQVNQEYKPLKERAVLADVQHRSLQTAKQVLERARAEFPHFAEHEKEMGRVMHEAQQRGYQMSLEEAYSRVVPAKLIEQLENEKSTAFQKALTTLQTKAGAASVPAPRTTAAVATDTSKMTVRQLLEAAYEG